MFYTFVTATNMFASIKYMFSKYAFVTAKNIR